MPILGLTIGAVIGLLMVPIYFQMCHTAPPKKTHSQGPVPVWPVVQYPIVCCLNCIVFSCEASLHFIIFFSRCHKTNEI